MRTVLREQADTLEALLREVVAELRLLRLAVDRQDATISRAPHSPIGESTDSDRYRHLLSVLALTVQDRAFTVCEVVAHTAALGGALAEALPPGTNCRTLGKLFRRLEGRAIGGLQLERIGTDRDGVIWRLRVCEFETRETRRPYCGGSDSGA